MGTCLLLNCSPTPHYPDSLPSELSATHPKETQRPTLHGLLLLPAGLVQGTGWGSQNATPARGSLAQGGSCTPALPIGNRSPWEGGQHDRQRRWFFAVLIATESTQWRNYASASAMDIEKSWKVLPL